MPGRHRSTARSALAAALSPRRAARHAKPSTVAPAVAAGGMTAVFVPALASPASAASSSDFARLRACESGGNYAINTGNGYYGAYQFDARTWRGLGYSGLPHQASAGTQDAAAAKLQAARGWQPWPGCSAKLGLGRSTSTADRSDAPRASRKARTAPVVKVAVAPTTPPPFYDHVVTTDDVETPMVNVERWQRRMAERGWDVEADGRFGPQTAALAKRFAAEKDLPVTTAGTLDKAVFDAAWTLKVT